MKLYKDTDVCLLCKSNLQHYYSDPTTETLYKRCPECLEIYTIRLDGNKSVGIDI
jgi:hypothetical protein